MTQYDEMTARVMVQSLLLDIDNLKIRKLQKNRIVNLLKSIMPDPVRYLEMQKGRFSFERVNIVGAKQDEVYPSIASRC